MTYPYDKLADNEKNNLVLGHFLDTWSRLEHSCIHLLHIMLRTDYATAAAIFYNTSGPHQYRNLFESLSETVCNKPQRKVILKMCGKIKKNATKRNKIVHGEWNMIFETHPENNNIEIRRVATTQSRERRKKIVDDPLLRNKEWFLREDIADAAVTVSKLSDDIIEIGLGWDDLII